jgi:hypothetical protein
MYLLIINFDIQCIMEIIIAINELNWIEKIQVSHLKVYTIPIKTFNPLWGWKFQKSFLGGYFRYINYLMLNKNCCIGSTVLAGRWFKSVSQSGLLRCRSNILNNSTRDVPHLTVDYSYNNCATYCIRMWCCVHSNELTSKVVAPQVALFWECRCRFIRPYYYYKYGSKSVCLFPLHALTTELI